MRFIAVLLAIFLTAACQKERVIPNYPLVHTLDPTIVGEHAVLFRASLSNRGNAEIIQRGFILGPTENLTLQNSMHVEAGHGNDETFSILVDEILASDSTYLVRSYVSMRALDVYGDLKSFVAP